MEGYCLHMRILVVGTEYYCYTLFVLVCQAASLWESESSSPSLLFTRQVLTEYSVGTSRKEVTSTGTVIRGRRKYQSVRAIIHPGQKDWWVTRAYSSRLSVPKEKSSPASCTSAQRSIQWPVLVNLGNSQKSSPRLFSFSADRWKLLMSLVAAFSDFLWEYGPFVFRADGEFPLGEISMEQSRKLN